MDQNTSQIEGNDAIPEGFVIIMGPKGQQFLVPEFYVPAMRQTLDGIEEKNKLEIGKSDGTVRISFFHFLHRPECLSSANIFGRPSDSRFKQLIMGNHGRRYGNGTLLTG